jgi:hypothetical protein
MVANAMLILAKSMLYFERLILSGRVELIDGWVNGHSAKQDGFDEAEKRDLFFIIFWNCFRFMILLGGNRDADNADGIEDIVADHQNLHIKMVMVSIQPNGWLWWGRKRDLFFVIFWNYLRFTILLDGIRNADDADGIEDAFVNHQNLDIKLVMVSIQPNRIAMMRQKKGLFLKLF